MSCSTCNSCNTCSNCSDNWNRSGRNSCSDWNNWNNGSNWNNWSNWNGWNNWGGWNNWNNWHNWNWGGCWNNWHLDGSSCNRWVQPILCNRAQFSSAGFENGATLVIHKIVLDACGTPSCTQRTFNIRVTGPSYPNGEIFRMRAGSCTELDEPLVITGLEPGTYCIEEINSCPNEFISTFTGPVCGREVTVGNSWAPTVITICSRRRLCRLCHNFGCGCNSCSACSGT